MLATAVSASPPTSGGDVLRGHRRRRAGVRVEVGRLNRGFRLVLIHLFISRISLGAFMQGWKGFLTTQQRSPTFLVPASPRHRAANRSRSSKCYTSNLDLRGPGELVLSECLDVVLISFLHVQACSDLTVGGLWKDLLGVGSSKEGFLWGDTGSQCGVRVGARYVFGIKSAHNSVLMGSTALRSIPRCSGFTISGLLRPFVSWGYSKTLGGESDAALYFLYRPRVDKWN